MNDCEPRNQVAHNNQSRAGEMTYHKMAAMARMLALLMTLVIATSASAQTLTTSGDVTATYTGAPMSGLGIATVPAAGSVWAGAKPPLQRSQSTSPKMIPRHTPQGANAKRANGQVAPLATDTPLASNTLLSNFDGLSDAQNKAITGFHDTPPDQGLCVGKLGSSKVVIEAVNSIFGIYTPGGSLLSAFPMTTGFADPNAFSDPVCVYDQETSSFFMTVISCFLCTTDTFVDVLVVNSAGSSTTYQFDTSLGGTCFGDQPHVGLDHQNFYVSTDEFCGPGQNTYSGALLIAISKSQLAAQGSLPNAVSFGPLSLGGVPILTLQPARSAGISHEYLLNSFPYDQFGNSNSVSNSLGLWSLSGEAHVTTGGTVTLTGRIIPSEQYAFPMPAASTGNGTTPSGSPSYVISEPSLNPDDSRMLQVQAVQNQGEVELWASLSSAVTIKGDPSARDGVAWFEIDAAAHQVSKQGRLGSSGKYLLYPAVLHSGNGRTVVAFSITSPTLNPSAAYAVMDSGDDSFGSIRIAATGTGAHVSFSDILFGGPRWGDYSAATLDLDGEDVWMATEYIGPPPGGTDPIDNWGTRVFELD
jgi:hypothetical protein